MNRISKDDLDALRENKSELESLVDQFNDMVEDFNTWQRGHQNENIDDVEDKKRAVLEAIRKHNEAIEEHREKIEAAMNELNNAISDYNDEAAGRVDELASLVSDMGEKVDGCETILDDLKGEAEEFFDDRSEKWQESESGDSYQSFMDALGIELEIPDEPEFCPLVSVSMDDLDIDNEGFIEGDIPVCDEDDVDLEDLSDLESCDLDLDELENLIDNPSYKDY